MGRHSVQADEAFGIVIDPDKAPLPGSRRAARLAALAQKSSEATANEAVANENDSVTFVEAALGSQKVLEVKEVEEKTEAESPSCPTEATEETAEEHSEISFSAAPLPSDISTSDNSGEDSSGEAQTVEDTEDPAAKEREETQEVKRSWFSLFTRSRAAVVAFVAAASGVATVGAASLALRSADAEPLSAVENSAAGAAFLSPNSFATSDSVTFTVTVDGQTREVTTKATTLLNALLEAGIIIDDDDKVSMLVNAPVHSGTHVTVTRVEKKTLTEDVTEAHASSQVEDANLPKGTTKVETKGVDGVTTNTYEIVYENGQEVGRTLLISSVKAAKVDEVVKVGTKESASSTIDTSGATAVPAGDSQQIAYSMLASYGWNDAQFTCLVNLWNKESKWNHLAKNPSSSAYGIPQALPGSKMASAGADWATNPATQIKWGLGYISARYGTPCGAWSHSQSRGWY